MRNDLSLAPTLLIVLTGPNEWQETYLRQTALICIMAQVGSFVPAQKASYPSSSGSTPYRGERRPRRGGTFFVEAEAHHTWHSQLTLFSPSRRGGQRHQHLRRFSYRQPPSYLHDHVRAFTLFATHYAELELADGLER